MAARKNVPFMQRSCSLSLAEEQEELAWGSVIGGGGGFGDAMADPWRGNQEKSTLPCTGVGDRSDAQAPPARGLNPVGAMKGRRMPALLIAPPGFEPGLF